MKPSSLRLLLSSAFLICAVGLLAADTDGDGLDDSVETGTGIYLSVTNTGTNPLLADTDGDGAGDWYEVATIDIAPTSPQPNAPNSSSLKPNIPYPLPVPSSTPPATNKPVKVYILSGQSNMVGQGNVDPTNTPGTLATTVKQQGKFPNLLSNGTWRVRNDVTYRGLIAAVANTNLKVGLGASAAAIGPELGFGNVMGYYHDEPVLILKSSEGGRALGWDFLPPGSVKYTNGSTVYAGYGESPLSWATGTAPIPSALYGGYQYDQCFLSETNMGAPAWANGTTYTTNYLVKHNGVIYIHKSLPPNVAAANSEPGVGGSWTTYWNIYSITNVVDVLDNFATQYPKYAAQGFEITGFAWFQGWNDGLSYTATYASRYETNMAQFIRQIRAYYENRYPGKIRPKAPFVIATCAFEGWSSAYTNQYPTRGRVINAQLAVGNPAKYPEFAGNVKTMEARGYWRDLAVSPANQGYHYHRNAETFMLVGDALGRGMIDLLKAAITNDYPTWAALYSPANLSNPNADHDGDGLSNDHERIWGLNPTNAASKNPFSFNTNLVNGNFTYTRRDPALTGLGYTVWASTNLVNWAQDAGAIQTPGTPVNGVQNVTVTLSPALRILPQLFVRLGAAP